MDSWNDVNTLYCCSQWETHISKYVWIWTPVNHDCITYCTAVYFYGRAMQYVELRSHEIHHHLCTISMQCRSLSFWRLQLNQGINKKKQNNCGEALRIPSFMLGWDRRRRASTETVPRAHHGLAVRPVLGHSHQEIGWCTMFGCGATHSVQSPAKCHALGCANSPQRLGCGITHPIVPTI